MWYIRVKIAVDRQNEKMKRNFGDIRKYGTVNKRRRRSQVSLHPKEQKSYKQLTSFSGTRMENKNKCHK